MTVDMLDLREALPLAFGYYYYPPWVLRKVADAANATRVEAVIRVKRS